MSIKHLFIVLLICTSCAPKPPAGPYDGIPILGKDVLSVLVADEMTECFGMAETPTPCFYGQTVSGDVIKFDQGIVGYTYRLGVSERIGVERIRYDFSGPNAPQDFSSYQYVLIKP